MGNLGDNSKKIAELMYNSCFDLNSESMQYTLQRANDLFWGKIVKNYVPIFKELHDKLVQGKHNKSNPLSHGDCDVSVWYETSKRTHRKVIVSTRHCSCADDNTHIFILDDLPVDKKDGYWFGELMCATVWPRQINRKGSYKYGDHRDIEKPSINTYRQRDFEYGYKDGRDNNYCFKYRCIVEDTVESAISHRISNALWTLETDLEAVKDYE